MIVFSRSSIDYPIRKQKHSKGKIALFGLVIDHSPSFITSFTQNTTTKMSDCVQVNLRITTNSNQGIILNRIFFSFLFIFDYYK
jgi:hypothetical protein